MFTVEAPDTSSSDVAVVVTTLADELPLTVTEPLTADSARRWLEPLASISSTDVNPLRICAVTL